MINLIHNFSELGNAFYQNINPSPLLVNPQLVHINRSLQATLTLNDLSDDYLIELLSGQTIVEGYSPLASVYMGHQFGVPVAQLGDGRALLIAEHRDAFGKTWELQLKGAGRTAYSRMGDGRAVLRSSIREYLASHTFASLRVPTTHAIAILASGDEVYREEIESAAVVLRVAPSFLRFGHFEYFARHGNIPALQKLIHFTLSNYFPDINLQDPQYPRIFLEQVVQLTAEMIAYWQSIGFVHGVMNSDNMSILGLTLDYGPYAFIDRFNPQQIFNHSDSEGRYTYSQQPYIGWWNLYRLAEALAVIYPQQDEIEETLAKYAEYYNQKYLELMAGKLGLPDFSSSELPFLDELLQIMQQEQIDWTYFWRQLSHGDSGYARLLMDYPSLALQNWFERLKALSLRQNISASVRQAKMLTLNPVLILRNHLLQAAIEAAKLGDYSEVGRLFTALSNPFQESAEFSDYYLAAPRNLPEVCLSCSS